MGTFAKASLLIYTADRQNNKLQARKIHNLVKNRKIFPSNVLLYTVANLIILYRNTTY